MTDAGFFRGTSAEQDNRFSDKEKKLLKQMKFGESVTKKVDMSKIKVDVLRPWISKRVEELLGMEDDVVEEFVVNEIEATQFPDGRRIQINLTGFLNGRNARIFTTELWDLLLSAQDQATGIPVSILDSKQEEIKKRNEEQEKLSESLKKTVSRFNDKLKSEKESPPRRPTSETDDQTGAPSKEKATTLGTALTTINVRKDEGSRRNYRTRRLSPSSPRRSRSRSRERNRRDVRRDNDRVRSRRSPARRSRTRSRSRSRDRNRDLHSYASSGSNSRRYFEHRDSYGKRPGNLNRDRDRGGAWSREYKDGNRDFRRDSNYDSRTPSPRNVSRNSRERDSKRTGVSETNYNSEALEGRTSSGDNKAVGDRRRNRSRSPVQLPAEESLEHHKSPAPDDSPIAKKSKKEKKEKRDKKKNKKHKKEKKLRKSKNDVESRSCSEDEDDASDKDKGDYIPGIRNSAAYVDSMGGDELEKRLREKALESLKKSMSSR